MTEHDNSVIDVVPLTQPRIVQGEQKAGFEIEVSLFNFVDVKNIAAPFDGFPEDVEYDLVSMIEEKMLTKISDDVWHYFLTLRLMYPQDYKKTHVVSFIGYPRIGKDNRLKWQTYIRAHPGLLSDNDARAVFIECRNACQNRLSQG